MLEVSTYQAGDNSYIVQVRDRCYLGVSEASVKRAQEWALIQNKRTVVISDGIWTAIVYEEDSHE